MQIFTQHRKEPISEYKAGFLIAFIHPHIKNQVGPMSSRANKAWIFTDLGLVTRFTVILDDETSS